MAALSKLNISYLNVRRLKQEKTPDQIDQNKQKGNFVFESYDKR